MTWVSFDVGVYASDGVLLGESKLRADDETWIAFLKSPEGVEIHRVPVRLQEVGVAIDRVRDRDGDL